MIGVARLRQILYTCGHLLQLEPQKYSESAERYLAAAAMLVDWHLHETLLCLNKVRSDVFMRNRRCTQQSLQRDLSN